MPVEFGKILLIFMTTACQPSLILHMYNELVAGNIVNSQFSYLLLCSQLFVMYDALSDPSVKRMKTITKSAVGMCTAVYLLVSRNLKIGSYLKRVRSMHTEDNYRVG